jgi:polyisoprenoid-binding protein YceI
LPLAGAARAGEWRLDPARSVFAVLTHRAGLAARLAHDHLIVAPGVAATLDFDPEHPEAARCLARAEATALAIDEPGPRTELSPRLVELGALDAPLPPVDAGDREKVRAAMLGTSQLDAERFREVSGELVALAPRSGTASPGALGAFDWQARIRLTVRGRTVEKTVPVAWRVAAGELTAEALGEFRFTDFGITPYSAVLGAVRNQDRFELYLRLVAQPAPAAPPPG